MATTRLRDVAARAGVSIRTVSNVVNGYAQVSDKTRLRVEKAVAELGYRPNLLARNLKRGRTGLLALVVPELDVPYFSELTRSVIAEGRKFGYTVVVDQTDGEPERERELIMRGASAALFDGVILSPLSLSQADLMRRDGSEPLVLLGERIAESPYDHVAIDNVTAAYTATAHLLSIGRRRIAAVGEQPYETGETAQLRTRGYRDAHAARGLAVDDSLVVPTPASTAPTAPRPWLPCSTTRRARPTRSSATTTCSPRAPSAPCSPAACESRRTSPSWGSTTSRPAATAPPP